MPRLLSTLPAAAAAMTMLWAATVLPVHADRGDRGARQERSDRADRRAGAEHGRSGGPHAAGVVRPGAAWGERRGPAPVRGPALRPAHGASYGPAFRPAFRPAYGKSYGSAFRSHYGPGYGPGYGYVYRPVVRGGWGRPIARHYPRHGLVIDYRPALWTLVTVGAFSYLYANGVYYREHDSGGYVVVAPPADEVVLSAPPAETRYVYPRQNQSADRQASDEYECHRWAVQQTGFDPSSVATGTARQSSAEQRAGYPRARDACLESRGYTVR